MTVVTRFAPSPTGFLHIGGARTALFNWLFSRHHGGRFLLRIEDTDRERSTEAAVAAIIDGLTWLGLDWDGAVTRQTQSLDRHVAVAQSLIEEGKAYYCYCTPEELATMREQAKKKKRPIAYDGRWRDRAPSEAPAGIQPTVRIKMPRDGETVIYDHVQGEVRINNRQLDDFIILRADMTPTYMLSVVVDDHDSKVTHVIRGDDHLNNAFRQHHLFLAAGWPVPECAHLPLIHGPDGKRMSKRHGALSVQEYQGSGYLPDALKNYLLRLGWSHGDDEIIDTAQAVAWFDLNGVGRSPAHFDWDKLANLNSHYLQAMPEDALLPLLENRITEKTGIALNETLRERLRASLPELTVRAKTLRDLCNSALFLVQAPKFPLADAKAAKALGEESTEILSVAGDRLGASEDWTTAGLEALMRDLTQERDLKLGKLAGPLRAALTGSSVSPGIFEVMSALGREECLARIARAATASRAATGC